MVNKVLVLGASGHIGNAVTRLFLDRGCQVTACGRREKLPANLAGVPVSYVAADINVSSELDRLVSGQDLVVDAAAPYPLRVFPVASSERSDPIAQAERRTRHLLDALTKHGAQLAYVSSFVTVATPQTAAQQLRAETMRLAHPYFDVKHFIESQMLSAARHGLRVVIVNPAYCLGPWDLHDRRLCTIPLLLSGQIPASIDQKLNVIDVRDVAAALAAAVDKELYGQPLLLSGHDIGTHALYSLICQIGGVPSPRFSNPTIPAIIAAYWFETILNAIDREAFVPSGGMMMATAFDYLTRASDLKQLAVVLRPLSQTIRDAIIWYQHIGYC